MDRRAFELGELRNVESSIADAARHTIARARARSPLASTSWKPPHSDAASHSSRRTWLGIAISAPNFCAWLYARAISAMPEMPVGKPR
jgi:hypothetical protein